MCALQSISPRWVLSKDSLLCLLGPLRPPCWALPVEICAEIRAVLGAWLQQTEHQLGLHLLQPGLWPRSAAF